MVVTLCSCFPWRDGARLCMVIRKCVVPAQQSSSSVILAVVPPTVLPNRVDLFGIDNDLCPCANCWFAHATVRDPCLMERQGAHGVLVSKPREALWRGTNRDPTTTTKRKRRTRNLHVRIAFGDDKDASLSAETTLQNKTTFDEDDCD